MTSKRKFSNYIIFGFDKICFVSSGRQSEMYKRERTIYGMCGHPQYDTMFAVATEDGKILTYDVRYGDDVSPLYVSKKWGSFNSVQFNPISSNQLVSTHEVDGTEIWDIRCPGK